MDSLLNWFSSHRAHLGWLATLSMIMLVVSVAALPWAVGRLPQDYFVTKPLEGAPTWTLRHLAFFILRNALGFVLVLAGIAMLILPGQGLLGILAGLVLMDYPKKRELEAWLIKKPMVGKPLNWLRKRKGEPPFLLPGTTSSD